MSWSKPSVPLVWAAIEVYVGLAYAGAAPPSAVRDRLASVRATGDADFYDSPVFERDDARPPTRYSLRLGNKVYPHMKLVIERAPDGRGHLFRADTHDKHIRPAPNSREARVFAELMKVNQKFAEEIEAAWANRGGIATFKQFLRDDLARRAAATSPPTTTDPTPPTQPHV
ncbi:MAG: hypothetical protein QOF78_4309 [Phycisphaerales bacterium]|jgi:hypothetical protein|nr:hypothetical protein [Phycisphaerales bacterium]